MWIEVVHRKRRQLFSRLIFTILLIPTALPFGMGQERGQWIVVKRFFAAPRKVGTANLRTSSAKSRAPIFEDVFFVDDLNGWVVGDGNRVARTRDGGHTWTVTMTDSPANLRGVFFSSKLRGWAVGDSGRHGAVFVTNDGGRDWSLQTMVEGFALSGIHKIWFTDEQHGWSVGEAQQDGIVKGIILATQNGGRDWQIQYLCAERCSTLTAVNFVNPLRGWVVGDGLILHTEDGGLHWREQFYDPKRYLFGLDVVTPTEGWAVGSGGLLLHTSDGGTSWESQSLPKEKKDLWLSSVKFINSLRGWVTGNDGAIFSTTDGGRRWKLETVGTSPFLRGLASTSHGLFAVGNNGIILRRRF